MKFQKGGETERFWGCRNEAILLLNQLDFAAVRFARVVAPGADDGVVKIGVKTGNAMHLSVGVGVSAFELDAVQRPGSGGDDLILFVKALQLAVAFHFEL